MEGTANPRLEILNEVAVYSTPVFKGGRGDKQMRQKARELTLIGVLPSSARG